MKFYCEFTMNKWCLVVVFCYCTNKIEIKALYFEVQNEPNFLPINFHQSNFTKFFRSLKSGRKKTVISVLKNV